MHGTLVKADVDVARGVLVLDMDMHADGEAFLLEQGSRQEDLWGINLHPEHYGTDAFIARQQSAPHARSHPAHLPRSCATPTTRARFATKMLSTMAATKQSWRRQLS
ncbi:hypothetical protein MRBLMI1_001153 [Microbacterium sp. LMI1-1-1.1]